MAPRKPGRPRAPLPNEREGLRGLVSLVEADVQGMAAEGEWGYPWSLEDLESGVAYLEELLRG